MNTPPDGYFLSFGSSTIFALPMSLRIVSITFMMSGYFS